MDAPWKWIGLAAGVVAGIVVMVLVLTGGDGGGASGTTSTTNAGASTTLAGTDTTDGTTTTSVLGTTVPDGSTTTSAGGTTTTGDGATTTTGDGATTTVPVGTTTTTAAGATTTTTRATGTTTTVAGATTTTEPALQTEFGDGQYLVGVDIPPGLYESSGNPFCYWERLSGLSGTAEDVIANDVPTGKAIVDIAPTDVAFGAEGCGTWKRFEPFDDPITEFGDGTWAVGSQIEPGRYGTDGGPYCYWARLTGFGGTFEDIVGWDTPDPQYDLPAGPAVVEIDATDAGFATDGCGVWTKSG